MSKSKSGGLKKKQRKPNPYRKDTGPSKNAKLKRSCFKTDSEWQKACARTYPGDTPASWVARQERVKKVIDKKIAALDASAREAPKKPAVEKEPPPSGTYNTFTEMSKDWFSDYNSQNKLKLKPVNVKPPKRELVNCTFTFVARTGTNKDKKEHILVKPIDFDLAPAAVLQRRDLDDNGMLELTIPAALAAFLLEKRGLACRA